MRDEKENRIVLEHGAPIRFGAEREKGVRLGADGSVEIVDVAEVGRGGAARPRRARRGRRRSHSPWAGSAIPVPGPLPIGVLRDVERPVYDELMAAQIDEARREKGEGDLSTPCCTRATPGRSPDATLS